MLTIRASAAARIAGRAIPWGSTWLRRVHSAGFDAKLASFDLRLRKGAEPLWVSALTLRDLCQCEVCWDHHNHQRRSPRVPEGEPPKADSVSASDAGLQVIWSDGHTSHYATSELQRFLRRHGSELPRPVFWDRDSLPAPPETQFASLATASGTRTFAQQIHTYGFSVLRNVPPTTAATDAVGELLGAKWSTSMFGTNWEVKIEAGILDSAYSMDEILHHTDGNYLPYRAPMQLFHCLRPGAPGTGVSSFIDGFALAHELRRRSEKAYEILTKQVLSYQYQDLKHDISAEHPVLQLNPRGELVAVNWNNHDRAAMPTDPELIEAMRLWDRLLQEERWHLDFTLQSGDLVVFDNLRLLHARKGRLDPGSPRHLVGFYLDNGVAGAIHKPRALQWAGVGNGRCLADLRSDTKTQPDGPMYTAMISATLGDDVARECETTRALESYVAELLGKEAALLVSSGTQGNLLAAAAQCPRGTEMILGDDSHMHLWEAGGPSVLFGIAQRTVPVDALGQLPIPALEASLALSDPEDDHCCRTRLVAIENSHGGRGGAVLSPPYMKELATLCHDRGLRLHVDGARLLNAATAVAEASSDDKGQEVAAVGGPLGHAARQLLDGVDTVSMCLSKGLGCPGGAVIAGDTVIIAECRRLRKLVGGSTRQASGLMAAAGLQVLRERDLFSDLRRDHSLMRRLVEGIRCLPGTSVDLYGGTNMAVVRLFPAGASATDDRAARVANLAKASGLQVGSYLGQSGWRFVTHRGVQEEDVDALVEAFARSAA